MNLWHQSKYELLGQKIAYYRKTRHLNQMQLAEKINISRTHMSRIENCDCAPSLDIVFDIADALDLPVYLFFQI